MTATQTSTTQHEPFLDRIGIPHPLRWGFLGVLVFMTGHGVESNFISPHLTNLFGEQSSVVITGIYGVTVIIGSYMSGALSDLFGPRRIMLVGWIIWMVFEAAFLGSLALGSFPLALITYVLRGFGYPLFSFSFLVWISAIVKRERNGVAVGWFYVMFTGGLPTLGTLWAFIFVPLFGGGYAGETGAMLTSFVLVTAGFLIVRFGVKEKTGRSRLAPGDEGAGVVIFDGLRLTVRQPKILMGFLVRLINTSPEFGMFVIMPAVITKTLGFGQQRWFLMTVCVYAGNILFNAMFGGIGDKIGWSRTVRWFGITGSAIGLLLWWYVPHWVSNSTGGYVVSVLAGMAFGIMLAGFVPMGAIMANLVPEHKGAAMAMYTTAAGGAAFSGAGLVLLVKLFTDNNAAVVWSFVGLYVIAFILVGFLKVPQDEKGARAH